MRAQSQDIIFHISNSEQLKVLKTIGKAMKMQFEITTKKFVKEVEFPSMTEKQIIDRVAIANKEIKQGKTISQDQLYKDSQNW